METDTYHGQRLETGIGRALRLIAASCRLEWPRVVGRGDSQRFRERSSTLLAKVAPPSKAPRLLKMVIVRNLCWTRRADPMRAVVGKPLLLRSFLSPRLVGPIATPNSIERSIRSNFVSYEAATGAADSDGNVVSLLNAQTFRVIAPREVIKAPGGFD